MIGICLLILAVNAVAANTEVENEGCISYHPQCPEFDCPDSQAVHLPYIQDCHKFYKCNHGGACLFPCPTFNNGTRQLVFNPEEQVCDYPWNVPGLPNCPDSPSSSTSTVSTPSHTPTTTPSSTTPGGIIPYGCLKECPPSGEGRLKHESKCNSYYDCIKGQAVLRKCLENLYFNCYIQECDRKHNLPAGYYCSDIEE